MEKPEITIDTNRTEKGKKRHLRLREVSKGASCQHASDGKAQRAHKPLLHMVFVHYKYELRFTVWYPAGFWLFFTKKCSNESTLFRP